MNAFIEQFLYDEPSLPCETGDDFSTAELQRLVDTGHAWQDEYTSKLCAAAIGSAMIGERKW